MTTASANLFPPELTGGIPRARRKRRARPKFGLNLTAMIDVTFLLLIYFMVATEFREGEEVYRVDLPDRRAMGGGSPFDLDEEPLRVRVASTGVGLHACQIRLEGPYRQPRDFDELFSFLKQGQLTDNSVNGLFMSDHPIIIEPTPTTRWQHALEAFNAAARAKYTNVTFGRPGNK